MYMRQSSTIIRKKKSLKTEVRQTQKIEHKKVEKNRTQKKNQKNRTTKIKE